MEPQWAKWHNDQICSNFLASVWGRGHFVCRSRCMHARVPMWKTTLSVSPHLVWDRSSLLFTATHARLAGVRASGVIGMLGIADMCYHSQLSVGSREIRTQVLMQALNSLSKLHSPRIVLNSKLSWRSAHKVNVDQYKGISIRILIKVITHR